jgi:RNA polymerase sigma-70 factor (ECF subfamily)
MATDPDPLQERYRRYLVFLAGLQVAPRVRAKIDVEGVVQQTLVDAWRAGPALAEAGRAAWLRRVLARNLADEFRRITAEKRDAGREQSLDAALAVSSAQLAGVLAADQTSPSARVDRDEQALRVVEALEQLPDAQREALVLQHWHGWSLADIGTHLDRTPAAVAGLIKRGLKRLRQLLHAED